jgi:truncated hemoglobin YjbI
MAFRADHELWAALEDGELLARALTDFYDLVYRDPRLSPFFVNTTKRRAIEKQFSFLRQQITGEKIYFGDRPRNAHHWMVISDELFDHREALLEGCLRARGLPEPFVARMRAIDERFRKQIVKAAPRPKRVRGETYPLEGWDALVLSIGTLCDRCAAEVDRGATIHFHVRTGESLCGDCNRRRLDAERAGAMR